MRARFPSVVGHTIEVSLDGDDNARVFVFCAEGIDSLVGLFTVGEQTPISWEVSTFDKLHVNFSDPIDVGDEWLCNDDAFTFPVEPQFVDNTNGFVQNP